MTPRRAVEWSLLLFCAALPVSIAVLNVAATLITVSLVWLWASEGRLDWRAARIPLTAALAVYVAAAAVTSAWGVDPKISFGMLYKDVHKLWLLAILLLALDAARPRRALDALGAGAVFVSLVGIGQTAVLRSGDVLFKLVRAHGFVHPVLFGEIIGLCWLGGLCHRLAGVQDARRRRALDVSLAVTGLAFLLNQTRGALLGLIVALLALGLVERRWRRLTTTALAGAPLLLIVWELLPTGHSVSRALFYFHRQGLHHAFFARLTLWKVGLQVFRDHPLAGVGPGNYKTVFSSYFSGAFDGESIWGSAHDLYIHQAAERGLIGLAALAGVLYALTAGAFERARRRADPASLWAYGACVAFLVMNLTEVAFQTEQVTSLLLFIWAWAETGPGEART